MPVSSNKTDPRTGGVYSDLENFEGWNKGMNNIQRPNSIEPKNQLVDALNVDFDDKGKVRTRKGLVNRLTGDFDGGAYVFKDKLYLTKDNQLLRFNDYPLENPEFLENISQNTIMEFLENGENLYFSNGVENGIINKNGQLEKWGIDSPIISPVCIPSLGGSLPIGTYMIACSYLYGSYETGVSPIEIVNITENQSKITIQVPAYSMATSALIYAQMGDSLYLIKEGFNTTIDNLDNLGKIPKAENTRAFPVVSNLSWYQGSIYGSLNNRVFYTNEFDLRQYNPLSNTFSVDNTTIRCIIGLTNSFIVATDNSIFKYSGNAPDFTVEKLFDVVMIPGTKFKHERKPINGFLTNSGVFTITNDGNVSNISESNIEFSEDYDSGSAMFRMQDGIISVVFSLNRVGSETEYVNKEYIKID